MKFFEVALKSGKARITASDGDVSRWQHGVSHEVGGDDETDISQIKGGAHAGKTLE